MSNQLKFEGQGKQQASLALSIENILEEVIFERFLEFSSIHVYNNIIYFA
jgi:hypothetical protein